MRVVSINNSRNTLDHILLEPKNYGLLSEGLYTVLNKYDGLLYWKNNSSISKKVLLLNTQHNSIDGYLRRLGNIGWDVWMGQELLEDYDKAVKLLEKNILIFSRIPGCQE